MKSLKEHYNILHHMNVIHAHAYAHVNRDLPAELTYIKNVVPHKSANHVHSYYHNVVTNTKIVK